MHEVTDPDVLLYRVIDAIEAPLAEPGEVEGGFPEGLAGNGSGVDSRPPQVGILFHQGDSLAEISGLGGAFFSGRARADHDEVECVWRHCARIYPRRGRAQA